MIAYTYIYVWDEWMRVYQYACVYAWLDGWIVVRWMD